MESRSMMTYHAAPQVQSYTFANQGRPSPDFKFVGSVLNAVVSPPVPPAYMNDEDVDSGCYSSAFYYPDTFSSQRVASARPYGRRSTEVVQKDERAFSFLNYLHPSHLGNGDCIPALQPVHQLPCSTEEIFARKVFVGGLPIDVDEDEIRRTFQRFGRVLVDWPRRPEGQTARDDDFFRTGRSMTGYVFLVFEEERSVQLLVNQCHKEGDKYYLFVSSPTMRNKPVQVRPWRLRDMDYMLSGSMQMDPRRTVFIGGVPRPTRAWELADCLKQMYGSVCYVGIDIDPELKYPKGAARVTFATTEGFIAAINGRFVHLPHADTRKRVEIKPYVMDEQMCDECWGKSCMSRYAPYFCASTGCMQYYCEGCWDKLHARTGMRADHRPLVRLGDQTKVLASPPHHNGHSRPPRGIHRNYSRLSQYTGGSHYL